MQSQDLDSQLIMAPRRGDPLYLPPRASKLTRLRVAVRALRVLEKQPDHTVAAPVLSASLDGDIFRRHAAKLLETPAGSALLAERPSLQKSNVDLLALGQLERGTVGRAFAEYFADNKILPFESPYEVRDHGDYLIKWYRETHDLHHIITEYGTDPIGEMEVQAFALGNLGFRVSMLILAFAALLRPMGMPPLWKYWKRLRVAYRRGKQSESLFSVRYEQYLEEKVETLQAALRIPRLPTR